MRCGPFGAVEQALRLVWLLSGFNEALDGCKSVTPGSEGLVGRRRLAHGRVGLIGVRRSVIGFQGRDERSRHYIVAERGLFGSEEFFETLVPFKEACGCLTYAFVAFPACLHGPNGGRQSQQAIELRGIALALIFVASGGHRYSPAFLR